MRIDLSNSQLMESVKHTTALLANKRLLICNGSRLTLTAAIMTPAIQQSLVGGTTTEDEALDIQLETNPDLLITSEYLEGGYGIRLIERAKQRCPEMKALIFLSRETRDGVTEAMDAGADAVMFMSSIGTGDGDFINALRRTNEGGIYYPKAMMQDTKVPPVLVEPLTDREVEVLHHTVDGMSNTEIAKSLIISVETVKSHIKAIMQKFGVRNRTQAVAYALTNGFINCQLLQTM